MSEASLLCRACPAAKGAAGGVSASGVRASRSAMSACSSVAGGSTPVAAAAESRWRDPERLERL